MKKSFEIWLCRNSKSWSLTDESFGPCQKDCSSVPIVKPSFPKRSWSPKPIRKVAKRRGFLNKGNTCYANAILQCLSLFPSFWSDSPSSSDSSLPLVTAFRKMIFALEFPGKEAVDTSPFLSSLQKVARLSGKPSFDVFKQQDVVEVLELVINELSGSSIPSSEAFNFRVNHCITCNVCFQSHSSEDCGFVFSVPLAADVQSGVKKFSETQVLEGANSPFCYICSQPSNSDSRLSLSGVGPFLIVQLNRFSNSSGKLSKNSAPISINPSIKVVSEVDLEVSCRHTFELVAVINHSGNLSGGHYTCCVKVSDCWWHCNDKAVVPTSFSKLGGISPYMLFYRRLDS